MSWSTRSQFLNMSLSIRSQFLFQCSLYPLPRPASFWRRGRVYRRRDCFSVSPMISPLSLIKPLISQMLLIPTPPLLSSTLHPHHPSSQVPYTHTIPPPKYAIQILCFVWRKRVKEMKEWNEKNERNAVFEFLYYHRQTSCGFVVGFCKYCDYTIPCMSQRLIH